jgi:hypothetical protein
MPSTVSDLFRAARLDPEGVVAWGDAVPETGPGVYVIALTDDPDSFAEARAECPLSLDRVDELLAARSELLVDGERPTRDELAARLRELWLGDEAIVYVGLAGTSLGHRVGAYYQTKLGARRPHAGGWPLKTLSILDELWVHFAACSDPAEAEHRMLGAFQKQVSPASASALAGEWKLPFANLEWGKGQRKEHGITGAREPRRPRSPSSEAPE